MTAQTAWLDDLDNRWPVARIKDHVVLRNGFPFDSRDFSPIDGVRLVRIRDLTGGGGVTYVDADVPQGSEIADGDLLVGMDGEFNVAIWDGGPAALNQRLCVLRAKQSLDQRFLGYVISMPLRAINDITFFTTVKHLSSADLLGERMPFPPLAAQVAIADYLDRETAQIDALIEAKRRMVELLEERWVTVRRHLTRVGRSPSKWGSVQLRRVARLQAGAAFPHENQGDASGTIPYVKVGDLANVDKDDRLIGASNRVAPEVATTLRSPVLPAGTIVLPKIGAALLTNRRAVLSEPSCLDQNVMGVTVYAGQPRFVYYCLASIDLGNLSTPGPVPLLNEEAALSVRIPWPPIEEQDAVVRALDAHRVAAKAPVDAIVRQLALLQERRQALITAAVTGQLDIPEAA